MLDLVSFTGADDNTKVDDLAKFVEGYADSPLTVELALLYFPEKEGQARNPSAKSRDAILEALPKKNVAAHLCGEDVFRRLLAGDEKLIRDLSRYQRVQVNINARKRLFSPEEVFNVYRALWTNDIPPILQYHEDSRDDVEYFAYNGQVYAYGRPYILFDQSRGKGVAPTEWPRALPGLVCGYAGGLNPSNIASVNAVLKARYDQQNAVYTSGNRYWLDMESGVRTNNEFDLDLCAKVMEAVDI